MLHGAGMAAVLGTLSSPLGKDVILLQGTSALDLTFEDAAKLLTENPMLQVLAGGPFFAMEILVADDTGAQDGTKLREAFLTLVSSASGARFFVNVVFPIFSDDEDEACRFAKDDDVDDENDERRVWVDILDQN